MSTDAEKRILKEFLDIFDERKLCEIARSVYHGGGITATNREDAELLLLTLPFIQVLSTKKVPLNDILKFLILKGLKPTTNLNRSSLCLAFKTLIESQPDFSRPLVQFQSTSQFQMTADNNMLALAQNNNMNCQPYQIMPMQIPNSKTRKDRENELLEEFIEMFAKHFYDLLNDLGVSGKDQLNERHFYQNCTMAVRILGGNEEINEKCDNSTSSLQCLLSIKKEHQLFFSPHLSDVKWKKESHGLVKIQIGGTLHQGVGRMVGMFEQQFILREDPQAENTWKVLNTNLMMKSMDTITAEPTLSIQGQQRNNLQIDSI